MRDFPREDIKKCVGNIRLASFLCLNVPLSNGKEKIKNDCGFARDNVEMYCDVEKKGSNGCWIKGNMGLNGKFIES